MTVDTDNGDDLEFNRNPVMADLAAWLEKEGFAYTTAPGREWSMTHEAISLHDKLQRTPEDLQRFLREMNRNGAMLHAPVEHGQCYWVVDRKLTARLQQAGFFLPT